MELTKEQKDVIDNNLSAIQSIKTQNFPEQTIPVKASIREAIDIFYIVNASGINLTEAELALAQISGYWPKARAIFKAKLVKLEKQGFVFKLDFLVYCLLAVTHFMGSDMRRLHNADNKENLQAAWEKLDDLVLDYMVNIMRTHAYVDHTQEINSVFALIPIITFIFMKNGEHLSESEIKKAVKWFYYSQIWQRYISQTPQKLDKDLGIVRDNKEPFGPLTAQIKMDRTSLEITANDFIGRGVSHPLFAFTRWYFKSEGAVCFTTGVGLHENMGKKYKLEKDHIFPYSALKNNGYDMKNRFKYALAQELTNRVILSQIGNRRKSSTPAFDYLLQVKDKFPGALKKQCVTTNENLWHLDNFEDFLADRRNTLAKELNGYLDNLTTLDSENIAPSWEDIISIGEHDRLEMKETLRWDVKLGRVNKELETVILKTISAFNNAEGGTLIIGVHDKSLTVVGLERDYSTLKDGSKDGFELHLKNLINKEWGVSFGITNIKIEFPCVNGVEFCSAVILKGNNPLFLTTQSKNGQKIKKFHVRSGNASPPIDDPEEAAEYIAKRFPKLSRST